MKYFNNVKSYKELKEYYKKLLKENHPDNGGDVETMQEINAQFDVAFAIWKSKAAKENTLAEEEKTETAKSTKRHFYTAFGWEGSRYDGNLTLKEIAKIVRNYVKEKYPTCKFSVRTSYASMCQELHVELKEFPEKMYKTADDLKNEMPLDYNYCGEISDCMRRMERNGFFPFTTWDDEIFISAYEKAVKESNFYAIKTEYYSSVLKDVDNFVQSYNYDDSDSMTDYFDNNFYYFGCGSDHCEYVPKVARIKNKESKPATTKAAENPTGIETNGERYTVTESTHTKTGEKIFLVKWIETLDRDNYKKLAEIIKTGGGYYSRFTHSFIFKENPSEFLKGVSLC